MNKKKSKAVCILIEGTEGVGKTTQIELLASALRARGNKVLKTKEPGTPHSALTMRLRRIMLDSKYKLPRPAQELICQAIRSIHVETVVRPALREYDYIIQDRGALSGLAYAAACGDSNPFIEQLTSFSLGSFNDGDIRSLYDRVIVLAGDPTKSLKRAKSAKQEFKAGDAMEAKGAKFMRKVRRNFLKFRTKFNNSTVINVDGKSREAVLEEILSAVLG
jgi:dTMP kinase